MSSEAIDIPDDTKVKLLGSAANGCVILDHVPGWYGEACGQGVIRKIQSKSEDGKYTIHLEVKTPTKIDICKTGDVIKKSLNGGLFVRHFSRK